MAKKINITECDDLLAQVIDVLRKYHADDAFIEKLLSGRDAAGAFEFTKAQAAKIVGASKKAASDRMIKAKRDALMLLQDKEDFLGLTDYYTELYSVKPWAKYSITGKKLTPEQYRGKMMSRVMRDRLSSGAARGMVGRVDLENTMRSMIAHFHTEFDDALSTFRPNLLGLSRNPHLMDELIQAVYTGKRSQNAAVNTMARALAKVQKAQRELANRYGANIPELKDRFLPQPTDRARVKAVSEDEYIDFVLANVDHSKLAVDANGKPTGDTLSEKKKRAIVKGIRDTILTEGFAKTEKNGFIPHHVRVAQHRRLHFPTAENWINYANTFGYTDKYNSIMSAIDMMSKEIAALRTFGPNHVQVVGQMERLVNEATGGAHGTWGRYIYENLMARDHNGNFDMANAFAGWRAISSAPKIGFATVSAISDVGFRVMQDVLTGQPILRGLLRFMKNLNPLDLRDREAMVRLGLGAEYAIASNTGSYRIADIMGHTGASKYSEFMFRASGLNRWTQANKESFQIEFLLNMGAAAKGQADPKFLDQFAKYGLGGSRLERILVKGLDEMEGVPIINPTKLDLEDQIDLVGMVKSEAQFVAPESNAKVRTVLSLAQKRGTLIGELVRSGSQFKTFPVSVMLLPLNRALHMAPVQTTKYLTGVFTINTILGYVSMHARDWMDGKDSDPFNITNHKISRAIERGGSLGLVGDFIFRSNSGSDILRALTGPAASDALEVAALVGRIASFDMEGIERQSRKVVKQYTPKLWWASAIWNRGIKDAGAMIINPNEAESRMALRK